MNGSRTIKGMCDSYHFCSKQSFDVFVAPRRLFGKPDTQYDFSKADIDQLKNKAMDLEKSQEAIKKKLNPKVMNMIEKCVVSASRYTPSLIVPVFSLEKREGGLQKMLSTVLKDKGKIEATIENLDKHKREALQKTWEKVNGWVVYFTELKRLIDVLCALFAGISVLSSMSSCLALAIPRNYSLRTDRI